MTGLKQSTVRAVRYAILQAWADATTLLEHDSNLRSERTAWSMILDEVYSALQSCAGLHNTTQSVTARLPNELLVQVFAVLPFCDRLRATHTCVHWRAVATAAAAQLWTRIPYEMDGGPLDVLESLLDRWRVAHIRIECPLAVAADNISLVADLLRRHLSHTTFFYLDLAESNYTDYDGEGMRNLQDALQTPAPVLDDFALSDWYGVSTATAWAPHFFSGEAPQLATLKLYGVPSETSVVSRFLTFSTVRTLRLGGYRVTFTPAVWDIFHLMPTLHTLNLEVMLFDDSSPGGLFVPPASLQCLLLETGMYAPSSVLRGVAHQTIPHLALSWTGYLEVDELLPFLRPSLESMQVLVAVDRTAVVDRTAYGVHAFDSGGLTRSLRMIDLEMPGLSVVTFGRVTSLTLHGVPESCLDCPLLRHLTFAVSMDCDDPFAADHFVLSCPKLETVRLIAVEDTYLQSEFILPAGKIVALLKALQYDAPKLVSVTLCGIQPRSEAATVLAPGDLDAFTDRVILENGTIPEWEWDAPSRAATV